MARRNEKKIVQALESDPSVYRREAPRGSIEVARLNDVPYGQQTVLVGRLVLTDKTGTISKLGVFVQVDGVNAIVLERIEGNGSSVPAYLTRTPANIMAMNSAIHYGDVVMVSGVRLNVEGQDVFLGKDISVLAKALRDVYDSNIDFRKKSNLYAYRHLQLIQDPGKLVHFRKCSMIFRAIRQFLYREGYEELNMTLLQKNFEAGLSDSFVTHANEHGRDMYLRVTSELMLRKLMIGGFSKVFEIGRSFRNQGATADTLPQFTILELYRAYASKGEMEELVEGMVRYVLLQLYGAPTIPVGESTIACEGPWPRYDFVDELEKTTGCRYDESRPLEDLLAIMDKAGLARPKKPNRRTVAAALYGYVMSGIRGPAFLRDLPAAQSPLFKVNDDGSTVDETLLVVNGMLVADLVNPERDPRLIHERMVKQLDYRKDSQQNGVNEDFVQAMQFGLPPCRGVGMGLERFLMLLLNVGDIRDVELFPVF